MDEEEKKPAEAKDLAQMLAELRDERDRLAQEAQTLAAQIAERDTIIHTLLNGKGDQPTAQADSGSAFLKSLHL